MTSLFGSRSPSRFSLTLVGAAIALGSLAASADVAARELKVSTVLSDAFPWGQAAQKWADLVEERSDGELTLRVFPNSQLVSGDQTREFSAMRSGLIDLAVGSTINWSPQVPELNLFSLPFLMPDESAVDAITEVRPASWCSRRSSRGAWCRWPGARTASASCPIPRA